MGIDFDQNIKQVKKEQTKLAEIRKIINPMPVEATTGNDNNSLSEESNDDNKTGA